MQNHSDGGGASRSQPKALQWRFRSVEKNADGSTYESANLLEIHQFDDSVSTQGRVQEIQKMLQHLPSMQQIEQAKQKLDVMRAENKIWYRLVKEGPGSQPQDDDANAGASGSPAAAQGNGNNPSSGKQ